MSKEVLGRKFNYTNHTWEAPGMVSVPDEVMQHIQKEYVTMADLLYVLTCKDKHEQRTNQTSN